MRHHKPVWLVAREMRDRRPIHAGRILLYVTAAVAGILAGLLLCGLSDLLVNAVMR